MASNKERLINVNNRINVARAKVQKIVGTRRATQVFSSAKYPAPEALDAFKPLFASEQTLGSPYQPHHIEGRIVSCKPIVTLAC